MSGHSKWSQIKRQKGAADERRGQLFTKLGRQIALAVQQEGGGEPENNFKLRLAIDKARKENMPRENIKRAIERGLKKTDGEESNLEEIIYEGFGPGNVAVIVECATDNKNRTLAEIKNLFEKAGGRLTGQGSISYLFKKMGRIEVLVEEKNVEEMMLKIMDVEGVEDIEKSPPEQDPPWLEKISGKIVVYTVGDKLAEVRRRLCEMGMKPENVEMAMEPKTKLEVKDWQRIEEFLEKIREHNDVQAVFSNFLKPQ